jgi:hypothetical protein
VNGAGETSWRGRHNISIFKLSHCHESPFVAYGSTLRIRPREGGTAVIFQFIGPNMVIKLSLS